MSAENAKPAKLDPDLVHVLRYKDAEQMRAAFRHALQSLVKIRTKEVIAIKPNLGSPFPEHTGTTTALWMIEETVNYVRKRRGRPIICEAPSDIHSYEHVLEVTGAGALFDRLEVEHIDARTDCIPLRPLKYDSYEGPIYHVNHAVLGADGIICLPKLKTHNRTGVTLGMMGMMGLLSAPDRHLFHRRGVEDDVVELFRRLKERIRGNFIDGIIAMEGDGPTQGKPVEMNVVVCGQDMVSVDSVASQIMGFDSEEIDHLRKAGELGLGNRKRYWKVSPDGLPLPMRPFERAREDNGLRAQLMAIPPISQALRILGTGVTGRAKRFLHKAIGSKK